MHTRPAYERYRKLMERHHSLLLRHCWDYAGGNADRSRDMAQEVCLAVWSDLENLRPDATEAEERTWLRLIIRRTLYRSRRGVKPDPARLEAVLREWQDDYDARMHDEVEGRLELLSPDEAWVVRQRLAGYTSEEIARQRGVTASAVRHQMQAIIRKLQKLIHHE